MIRINLATTRHMSAAMPGTAAAEGGGDTQVSEQTRREGLTKLLVILMAPAALFFYEQQNIPTIQAEMARKQNALMELQTYNAQAENAVNEIKKFKEDEKKIQARIAALEKIAKDRFREVKVLDLFQQVIPERVWFTRVDIKEGRILLAGFSTSDVDISTFMDSLSKSVFLQEVVLVSSSEHIQDNMTLKKFEISCVLDKTMENRP
ncbi:PilN domain-containing protein [Bdellovibrio sp. HCB337]|uniref:PilN domain-containing protein n=1 Tax=Bdellovibrio sp. HCB337 TaxID=3394358 RepID=UPI0039A7327B